LKGQKHYREGTGVTEGADISGDTFGVFCTPEGQSSNGGGELNLGRPPGRKRSRKGKDEATVGTPGPLISVDILGRSALVYKTKKH
jgi:hypothetical protein